MIAKIVIKFYFVIKDEFLIRNKIYDRFVRRA